MRLSIANTTKHYDTQAAYDKALKSIVLPASIFKHLLISRKSTMSTIFGSNHISDTPTTNNQFGTQETVPRDFQFLSERVVELELTVEALQVELYTLMGLYAAGGDSQDVFDSIQSQLDARIEILRGGLVEPVANRQRSAEHT